MVQMTCFTGNISWRSSSVAFRSLKGRAFAERKTTLKTLRPLAAVRCSLVLHHAGKRQLAVNFMGSFGSFPHRPKGLDQAQQLTKWVRFAKNVSWIRLPRNSLSEKGFAARPGEGFAV